MIKLPILVMQVKSRCIGSGTRPVTDRSLKGRCLPDGFGSPILHSDEIEDVVVVKRLQWALFSKSFHIPE